MKIKWEVKSAGAILPTYAIFEGDRKVVSSDRLRKEDAELICKAVNKFNKIKSK